MPFISKSRPTDDAALNANAGKLGLPLKNTRFPLASPDLEETDGNLSKTKKARLVNNNENVHGSAAELHSTDSENGDTSGYDEFHLEKYTAQKRRSLEKPARAGSKRSRENGGKKTRPGLNVVTDFSSSARRAPKDPSTERSTSENRKFDHKTVAGIGPLGIKPDRLADIAANPANMLGQTHPNALGRRNAYNEPDPNQSSSNNPYHYRNPTLESLKRSDTATTGPSPSARTVMIGIGEQDLDSAARESEGTNKPETPLTPSIIITPAYEDTIFPDSSISNDQSARRRPASSIYSQATAYARPHNAPEKQPPLPEIPMNLNARPPEYEQLKGAIVQGNDKSPQTSQLRNTSEENVRGILRRSIDSVKSRPQSKGWWNLGLSPLLSRAGTVSGRKDPFADDNAPPVPPISPSKMKSTKGLGLEEKDWESEFSPQTPRRIGFDSSRASTWSSWSDWERARDGPDFSTYQAHEAMKAANQYKSPELLSTSPVIGGLAAEYFHASAHDLISPAPYFECQNHNCAEKLPKLESIHDPISSNERGFNGYPASDESKAKSMGMTMVGGDAPRNTHENIPEEAVESRQRSGSDSTVIEDTPSCSPTSPQAKERTISGIAASAPSPDHDKPSGAKSPPPKPPQKAAIKAPPYPVSNSAVEPPFSPSPVPPTADRELTHGGAIPMSEVQSTQQPHVPPVNRTSANMPEPVSRPPFVRENSDNYVRGAAREPNLTAGPPPGAVPLASPAFFVHEPPPRNMSLDEDRGHVNHSPTPSDRPIMGRSRENGPTSVNEKHESTVKKPGLVARIKELLPKRKSDDRKKKKRCLIYVMITAVLLAIIITILLLALLLSRGGDNTPTELQWLNLTGYPPIPTGISTIAQPDLTHESSNCVFPRTMWSCSLPKEQQESVAPNNANQPNFRMEIRFKNGTVSNGTAPAQASKRSLDGVGIMARSDPFTNDLFTPNPPAPSLAEQSFLGNTTDNTTSPFEGEATPFFITFLDAAKLGDANTQDSNPSKVKRQSSPTTTTDSSSASSSTSSNPSTTTTSSSNSTLPSLPTSFPPASSLSLPNGTASPALLYPLPISQPLRLFDRGLDTEHYGFYSYFSRSIFLRSNAPLNSTTSAEGDIPDDQNGGSPEAGASVRCTWAQTRFLVQIWTKKPDALLSGSDNSNANKTSSKTSTSSANDFDRPGSMPYPVTITLDRHGGDPETKLLFCYAVDERQRIVGDGKVQEEFRGVDGRLVNKVPGLFDINGNEGDGEGVGGFDIHAGGVDGGTGGCGCAWSNFNGGKGV
ncbi:MAG: hypothetical protein Q9227_004241 [Pyrenula ochraceoflavens]